MNGITVLGYAFGPKVFCEQFREKLKQLKGTYVIFQYFKSKPKVPTCLPVNHDVEIVVTRRTILTPVTVQKDYKDFRARPTNPEKQSFARRFSQGHKTPAAVKETARKQKQREPNAKKKLIMLDGQTKIFEYAKDPVSCPTPSIVDPATDPYADLRSCSEIYSISTKLPNPSRAPPTPSKPSPAVVTSVVMGSTSSTLSLALISSVMGSSVSSVKTPSSGVPQSAISSVQTPSSVVSRSPTSSIQTASSVVSRSSFSSLEAPSSGVSRSTSSSLQTPPSVSSLTSARSPPQGSVGGSPTSSQEGVYNSP